MSRRRLARTEERLGPALAAAAVEAGRPVADPGAVRVVAAMVAAANAPAPSRRPRLARGRTVAGVFALAVSGSLVATGSAAATGSLPDPIQSVAHDTLEHVGVHLPDRHHRPHHSDQAPAEDPHPRPGR